MDIMKKVLFVQCDAKDRNFIVFSILLDTSNKVVIVFQWFLKEAVTRKSRPRKPPEGFYAF